MIDIEVLRSKEELTIKVVDNGGGINKKVINSIFEPYISTKEEQQGTGLGLYMSKLIIEKNMNGDILVQDIISRTKFKIVLPISKI